MQNMLGQGGRKALPVLASGRQGSSEPFFGSKGELNASSKVDAIHQLAALFEAVSKGQITFDTRENANVELSSSTVQERRSLVIEAYNDRAGNSWSELGSSIGGKLYETAMRDGFMRRLLARVDVEQGNDPRINVRFQNVTAMVASGPAANHPHFVRQKYLMPQEFYVTANPRVELREITRGSSDLLDDVFQRSQEQLMVTEDKVWLRLANATVGMDNNLSVLSGGITPANLAALRTQVSRWGLPTETLLMTPDGWSDIVGNASAWGNLFDQVTRYEIVQTGYIGTVIGMKIITDGFRDPLQRVLSSNDLFVVSSPIYHGGYTDRGPAQSTPVDSFERGIPARGWDMYETISAVLANSRSVAKGQRG